jgi:hypothetical protein
MTASNTPKPGDERTPDERPDATTEILAGLADPDRTPTEVLADADGAGTTKVLPEASAHSTLVPPKPKATEPTTRVRPEPGPADPPAASGSGSAPAGPGLTPPAPSMSDTARGPYPRPHVRWAGIIWGLVFAVAAALLLWVLAEDDRRDAVGAWWATLTPIGFALTALLVAGGLLLIGGVAGLARRLTHRRA